MTRCTCKTLKGDQCKKDAVAGSKTCAIHKKCTVKAKVAKKAGPNLKNRASSGSKAKRPATRRAKKSPVRWVKSKAWESPEPYWMKGGDKVKTKAMTPTKEPGWWLL